MTALNVTFADPNGPNAAKYGAVTDAVNQAFTAWMSHFDAPQGAVTINVHFASLGTNEAASAAADYFVRVGSIGARADYMSGFAAEVETGGPLSSAVRTAELNLDTSWVAAYFANPTSPASATEIQRVLQHEIGHMLGVDAFTTTNATGPVTPSSYTSNFDSYLQFSGKTETFVGPNAVASYGGPVNMDYATVVHPYVPGGVSLLSYLNQAVTIQPLDLAMLRDTGLNILSNQEVQEHVATRLYQAAFGRAPDAVGLMDTSRALIQGAGLNQVAAAFVGSAEFTARYGAASSDAAFVSTLYQNVLHRAGDAGGVQNWLNTLAQGGSRATVLAGFSESAENRAALNVNPNLSYSETSEAQTERLYDAAFGRAPDSAGFNAWSHALLNGTTLQQAAASFIGGPEYASRYGAAATNGAYVDALYQNTLHRAADAPGRAHWLDLLNGNALGRADLLVIFSEAAEHVGNVIAKDTAVSAGLLVDPSAHLGSIPVIPATIGT